MQTWQYAYEWIPVSPQSSAAFQKLNMLGSEGWELVSIQPAPPVNGVAQFLFFFKKLLG